MKDWLDDLIEKTKEEKAEQEKELDLFTDASLIEDIQKEYHGMIIADSFDD